MLVALVTGILSGSAFAQPRLAVLDAAAVPYLDAAGRDTYARFLLLPLPRAVAVAPNGKVAGYHDPTPFKRPSSTFGRRGTSLRSWPTSQPWASGA